MSLIGPRPHALGTRQIFESILSDYAFRHQVKQSISGWAQCNRGKRSIEHIAKRVKLDLYINNWSLRLDIQILINTFLRSCGGGMPTHQIGHLPRWDTELSPLLEYSDH
jgi:lipopolysaccharide/colanic/teichoic acid biosynthesis glycosyltransferase